MFNKRFGSLGTYNLLDPQSPPSVCERVIATAQNIKKSSEFQTATLEELFEEAVRKLKEEGVNFEKRRRSDEGGKGEFN